MSSVATRFSECLNAAIKNSSDPDVIVALITNVFLEVMRLACLNRIKYMDFDGVWHVTTLILSDCKEREIIP